MEPVEHQRAAGAITLDLGPGPRGARVLRLDQRAPLRVLFPSPDPGDPLVAALLNCAGGLAGGDAHCVTVRLAAGAHATLATAAAEKAYRSLGPAATVRTRLVLDAGARFEFLPQETIVFDGARLDRRLRMELAAGAALLAAEVLVFGRAARGERLRHGRLHDAWRLDGPGGPLWADALTLEGDIAVQLAAPFGFAGAGAMGTVLLGAAGARGALAGVRALPTAARGGATVLDGAGRGPDLLLARWLGDAAVVRGAVAAAVVHLRATVLGLPARLPRLWTT